MAIYYMGVKSFGRSAGTGGSISTSAAAYRAGERIRDERTDRLYDHSQRRDVEHKEIVLPSDLTAAGAQLAWARDRSQLWNAVERSEPRPNARVAREYVLALPHELNVGQRVRLARTFAQEISDRYRNAVDLAIHQPRSDPRNFHAHLLSTTREVSPTGLGPKTIAELSGSQRFELGLPRAMEEHAQIRARWAVLTNEALRDAGLDIRISHIADSQALLQPDARAWLPRVAWEIEKRGGRSPLGDRAREQFALRRSEAVALGAAPSGSKTMLETQRRTAEEIRQQAIDEWRAMHTQNNRDVSSTSAVSIGVAPQAPERGIDLERQIGNLRRELGRDDFSL